MGRASLRPSGVSAVNVSASHQPISRGSGGEAGRAGVSPQTRRVRPPAALRARAGRGAGAFTLLETALATLIVGIGVLSLIEAQTAFLRSNSWSTQSATATYLANEVRELVRRLPKHDPVDGLFIDSNNQLVGWGPSPAMVELSDFNHLDAFDGLRLSADGSAGFADGDLPGPVDAFATVIPQIDSGGAIVRDRDGNPVPIPGWAQVIRVEKVDPFNSSVTYPNNQILAANPGTGFTGLAVDQFPLRVTVTVMFRGPFDDAEEPIATVSWVVP